MRLNQARPEWLHNLGSTAFHRRYAQRQQLTRLGEILHSTLGQVVRSSLHERWSKSNQIRSSVEKQVHFDTWGTLRHSEGCPRLRIVQCADWVGIRGVEIRVGEIISQLLRFRASVPWRLGSVESCLEFVALIRVIGYREGASEFRQHNVMLTGLVSLQGRESDE